MITVEFNYQMLLDKIRTEERFDFSRWGDGEWNAVYRDRKTQQNCDGHFYYDDMGEALLQVLKDKPDYYIGMQNLAYRQRGEQIDKITAEFELQWCAADFIHKANIKKRMNPFFEVLTERDVLLVGPQHLYKLAVKHGWYMIEIPVKNCWLEVDEIAKNINALISHKHWVILYCAGMPSNYLIHQFRGQVTQIDMGSVLDPHAGIISRSYHHNL